MREVHGIVAKVDRNPDATQQVRITDMPNGICLFHTNPQAAILTAEEARFIARELNRAAARFEKREKK